MKICKCGGTQFHKNKRNKDGLADYCKDCMNKMTKKWRDNNKDYEWSKDKASYMKEYFKTYDRNPSRRKYRATHPWVRIRDSISRRIRELCKKNSNTMSYVGCDVKTLKEHLQATAIKNGYNDFNVESYDGNKYHVDHIKPCSSFDLTDDEEVRKCFHYTNLQILTASENLIKSDNV